MKTKLEKIFSGVVLCLAVLSQYTFAQTGQAINSWVQLTTAPGNAQGAGVCVVYVQKEGKDKIYSMRGGSNIFQIYDIETDVWISTTNLPYNASTGASMTWDGENFIYMLLGGTTFYQYDISASTFTRLADPPGSIAGGGAIVYVSTSVDAKWCYAFQGGTNVFWRYNILTNEWSSVAPPGAATGAGSNLLWTGDNYIYGSRFGSTSNAFFKRYNIDTDTWESLQSLPTGNWGAGGSLCWDGVITSSNIYAIQGGGSTNFLKYNISQNQWVTVQSLPIAVGTNTGNRLARVGDYIYGRLGSTNATDSFWRYRWRDVDPPGKITSFVAETGTNGGEINLSWVSPGNDGYIGNLPSGSTFYIQYSSMTENVVFSTSSPQNVYEIYIPTGPVLQGTTVYYTVGGLQENVTYYFRIWTKDNSGNWSEISNGATAWAQVTPLASAPNDLEITNVTTNIITLSWSLSGAATYWVEHSTISSPYNWIWRSSVPAPGNMYQDVDLEWGTTYWYRLIAVNSVGKPNYDSSSNIVSSTTYPGVPTDFNIQARTSTSITWTWTPPNGFADGYKIYQATSPTTLVATVPFGTNTYEETGLSTNTAYGRYVRSYNIVGESLDSNHATFYTLAVPPENLQITEVYSSSVTLTWQAGGNPQGTRFGLARAEDENFTVNHTTFVSLSDNLTELTTTATGLGEDTTYYFRVWAYNGDGIESGYSNIVSTKTLPGPPATPLGLYGIALSTVSIKWEWNITKNATYYQVYDADNNSLLANLEGNGTTTWIEVGLSSNTQYTRYIKAGNEYGLSAPSLNVSRYTLAYPPTVLNAVAVSSSTIDLSWNYSGATKYQIWCSTVDSQSQEYWLNITTVASPTLTYQHQNLLSGVTYYYRIYPVNGDDIVNTEFDFPSASTRTYPSPVGSFYGIAISTTSINWQWEPALGADGYKIYSATDNSVVAELVSANTFYVESGFAPNQQCGRYIRAFNTTGLGELSAKTTVYTLANPPTNLTVIGVNYNSVLLSWSANNNHSATRYEVSQSTDNFVTNFSTPIKLTDNYTNTTADIDGLAVDTEYFFRVRAFNGDDVSTEFSDIFSTKTLSYQIGVIIDESFDGETFPPSGWVAQGTTRVTTRYVSPPYSVGNFTASNYLFTPFLENPLTMTFQLYVTGSASVFTVQIGTSQFISGTWLTIFSTGGIANTWQTQTIDLSGYQNVYVRMNRTSGQNSFNLDDVKITGYLIPDTIIPSSISNLTALSTNIEGAVQLNWTSPGDDGEDGTLNNAAYRIKYSTINFTSFSKDDSYNIEFSTTGVPPKTEVSYIVRGLAPGTSYYFGIIARDDSNNWSTWTKDEGLGINTSNYAWTVDLPPFPPSQISAVSSNRSISLSWQHPSADPGDIDKYWVYQATFSFSSSTEENVVHIATVSYPLAHTTITGLTNGTEYFYRIRTVDKGDTGDGYYGEVLVGSLSDPPVSAVPKIRPPGNLVATHYGSYVSLSWEDSPDYKADNFAGYNIYRSTDNSSSSFFHFLTFSLSNSATDYSVEKTKTYYYLVRTSDTFGSLSDPSNIAEAIPDLIPPKIQILRQLTSRDIAKDVAFVEFKILDDRFNENDKQGKITSVIGKYRNIAAQNNFEKEIKITGDGLYSAEFIGKGELEFTIFVIGKQGVEYYLEAKDEVNITRWPKENEWWRVLPPEDKPEQKFITTKNPEIVFGKETQEVVIRDYNGNEIWRQKSDGDKLIIWHAEDSKGKKIESGAYIYQIKTKDGKRKYGVVIVVK